MPFPSYTHRRPAISVSTYCMSQRILGPDGKLLVGGPQSALECVSARVKLHMSLDRVHIVARNTFFLCAQTLAPVQGSQFPQGLCPAAAALYPPENFTSDVLVRVQNPMQWRFASAVYSLHQILSTSTYHYSVLSVLFSREKRHCVLRNNIDPQDPAATRLCVCFQELGPPSDPRFSPDNLTSGRYHFFLLLGCLQPLRHLRRLWVQFRLRQIIGFYSSQRSPRTTTLREA